MKLAANGQSGITFRRCARAYSSAVCTIVPAMPRPSSSLGTSVCSMIIFSATSKYFENAILPSTLTSKRLAATLWITAKLVCAGMAV